MQAAMDGHEIIVELLIGYVSVLSLPICLYLCMLRLPPMYVIITLFCNHYHCNMSTLPLSVIITTVCHPYHLCMSPLLPRFVTITPSVCHHYSLYVVLTILIISSIT